eukprot:g6447.t1
MEISPLDKVVPSDLLSSRADGALLATQDLPVGQLLFEEVPLAWQPAPNLRRRLCVACGVPAAKLCGGCEQVSLCGACDTCKMCPELSITRGHVSAFTLVALQVLRDWEEHRLPPEALTMTQAAPLEAQRLTPSVQKVAHFCSAVRWSDQRNGAALVQGRGGRKPQV